MAYDRTTFDVPDYPSGDRRRLETYLMSIFDAMIKHECPFAIVDSLPSDRYAVTPCTSIEDAHLAARSRYEAGAMGIRLYFQLPWWFGQVHYCGGADERFCEEFPSQRDCEIFAQRALIQEREGLR